MLIASTGIASAQPPPGYYDAAYMLSGPALRSALHDIISPHTVLPYSGLWDDFVSTDERDDDPAEVWDIYSDEPGGTPGYLYNFGTDQCGSSPGSEGVCFNREHTLPVSWFN
ncbi:MAG: endonuclease, partial [Flavobacteriales bacterium]|nr:endonuclease [Flavobacteriales bacterium]